MAEPSALLPSRFVAIDIRKHHALIGAVDANGRVVLPACPVALAALEPWLRQQLGPGDAVVIESPANSWQLRDLLAPLVGSVVVAHPQLVNLMPGLHTSADPRDTIKLARLHAAGLVPALWAPGEAARKLRALAAYRCRLIAQHAEASRRLGQILQRRNLRPPGANRLGSDRPDWWAALALAPHERASARDDLAAVNRAAALLAELDERLKRKSLEQPWQASVDLMIEISGTSRVGAITLLAAIGDISRFPSASQLVGYSGLIGDHRRAGQSKNDRAGVKEGRREIRTTMLEVAETAVRVDADWREVFEGLYQRIGQQRAMVAVARKLLVLLWHGLSEQPASARQERERLAA